MTEERVRGVTRFKANNGWQAKISVNGVVHTLGYCRTKAEAVVLRRAAETQGVEAAKAAHKLKVKADRVKRLKAQAAERRAAAPRYPVEQAKSGEVVVYRRQQFRCERTDEKVSGGGNNILIDIWASHCVECGERFEFDMFRPAKSGVIFYPMRRCKAHRKFGKRVAPVGMHKSSKVGFDLEVLK